MEVQLITHSKEKTRLLGEFVASFLRQGQVITLEGDLGAGKTTFVGGVAKGLHIQGDVISPTFNIMKCYFGGDLPLYHIDAYRLEGQNIELGLEEYIEGDGVCFIEWPTYIAPLIPEERLQVIIHNEGENDRLFIFSSDDDSYSELLQALKESDYAR